MKWQTGIVMEIIGRHVVVMTPQGEFRRIRMKSKIPAIGDEIRIPAQNGMFANIANTRWLAVAAAIILFMIASPLLSIMTQPPEVAVAYVSIDMNTSVELTVSNRNNVLDTKAYNSDGAKVLAGLDIKGVNYEKAVSQIGKKAIELGLISKNSGNTFVISLSPIPHAKFDKASMERTLLASANEVLSDSRVNGKANTIQVPVALRERASQKGISPAKYAVLLEAVNAGLSVTEKDMQEKSIEVAIASAGGEPEQIINQAREEEKFEDKEKVYIALLNKNSTIAMERAGGEESAAHVSENENNNGITEEKATGDEKQSKYKKPLVQIVRKAGDPEGSKDVNSGNKGNNVLVSVPPQVTPSDVSAANTSGQQTEPPASIGITNKPDSAGVSNNTDDVDVTNDDNTEENYMGSPVSGDTTQEKDKDLLILKPNF